MLLIEETVVKFQSTVEESWNLLCLEYNIMKYYPLRSHFPIQEVKSYELAGVLESGCSHHAQSQGTTPTNDHHFWQLDIAQFHSMNGTSQGFYEGRLPRWNTLRHLFIGNFCIVVL